MYGTVDRDNNRDSGISGDREINIITTDASTEDGSLCNPSDHPVKPCLSKMY